MFFSVTIILEGWLVGLRQEGLREGGGGVCLKHLKSVWNRKEGRVNKYFKKGEQAGSRVGGLKKRADWNPLTNYESNFSYKVVDNMIAEAEA